VSKSAVSSLRKWPEKMYVRVFAGEVFLFFCVFFAKKIAQKNIILDVADCFQNILGGCFLEVNG
jgi:hypothetical protein